MSKVEKEVITPRKGARPTSPQPIEKKKEKDGSERKSDTSRERKKG
ncbi:MAG: hypothetical protein H6Q78_1704 [Candidatus Krumholzibacteriota bacterium]|nr:hypothetical protein [Candidatus Krumholzibacteriota bacterium]